MSAGCRDMVAHTAPKSQPKESDEEDDEDNKGPVCFISQIKILSAAWSNNPAPLDVSADLPHVRIPVGTEEDAFKLLVAVDTCAGTNLGDYAFHAKMAELHPELVEEFKAWADVSEQDAIEIGGVGSEDAGVSITHIIKYKTPYRIGGRMVLISFGLARKVAATALVGITFLRKGKCLIDLSEPPTVVAQRLSADWDIEYMPPTCRPVPTERSMPSTTKTLVTKRMTTRATAKQASGTALNKGNHKVAFSSILNKEE